MLKYMIFVQLKLITAFLSDFFLHLISFWQRHVYVVNDGSVMSLYFMNLFVNLQFNFPAILQPVEREDEKKLLQLNYIHLP